MVKNLPSGAGDASSIPGQGIKIPHAAGQLSPGTVTSESLQVKSKTQCSNPPPKKKKKTRKTHAMMPSRSSDGSAVSGL